jgi:hypothetical protein
MDIREDTDYESATRGSTECEADYNEPACSYPVIDCDKFPIVLHIDSSDSEDDDFDKDIKQFYSYA